MCCKAAVYSGRGSGSGFARAVLCCTLCGAYPVMGMHLVFDSAALQMLRNDLPVLSRVYMARQSGAHV